MKLFAVLLAIFAVATVAEATKKKPTRKQCEDRWLYCESMECGKKAVNFCMKGIDPREDYRNGGDEEVAAPKSKKSRHEKCEWVMNCEATYCGDEAYSECMDGDDKYTRD